MGTDRRPGVRGRAVRISALLGCGVIVLAGCGSMPVSGDVKAVDASQPGDSQVQVYAVAPREGAPPSEIVDGFLESMTSDDPAFATTRKYLSADARGTWRPGGGTTVLAQAPNRSGPLLHDEANRAARDKETTYTLTGEKVAEIDAQSSYRPLAPPTTPRPSIWCGRRWRRARRSGASTSCRTVWSSASPTSGASTAR